MAVYRLDEKNIWFPSPEEAEDNGLLAVGGDLSVRRLLLAYRYGIFPWYNPGEEILWWCPKERFVIIPGEIHISRSMKKYLRRCQQEQTIQVTFNRDFTGVMHHCRQLWEERDGTWISSEMEQAYGLLHSCGFAMSTEIYQENRLIGGLYGVVLGTCFFGESMFSQTENASKIALISLAHELNNRGFQFIDCQFHTPHLESMGGKYISYRRYREMIERGLG